MPKYADPALVAQLGQPNSFYVLDEAVSIQVRAFAEDIEILTNNVSEAGAAAVARRIRPFGRVGMGAFELILVDAAFTVELGDVINIEAPSEWDGHRSFFVRGVSEDVDAGATTLKLLGGRT